MESNSTQKLKMQSKIMQFLGKLSINERKFAREYLKYLHNQRNIAPIGVNLGASKRLEIVEKLHRYETL